MRSQRKHRIRTDLLATVIFALFAGGLVWYDYAAVQRERATMALIDAVKRGDAAAVRLSLARGADANARDNGVRPVSLWQPLLDLWNRLRGQRPKAPANGPTVLQLAVNAPRADIVKALLENGANPNVRDLMGQTPLLALVTNWPFASGSAASIACLLEYGANVNAAENHGRTALMIAVLERVPVIVKMLLKHGADTNAKDQYNLTALLLAMPNFDFPGDVKAAKMLLEAGADVNARDADGQTPLMHAARGNKSGWDSTPFAAALVQHGADVNAKDKNGRTALMYALHGIDGDTVTRDKKSIVVFLLAHGADVHVKDKQGRSVSAYVDRDDPRMKPLLEKAGAKAQ